MGGRTSRGHGPDRALLLTALGVEIDAELLTLALTHRSYAYE
ncbi:MAG: ribonuclease III, partial [Pseudonocardiaceae bacterium]